MMPANRFKRLNPGEPLSAAWLNALASAVERLLRLKVSAPLTLSWSGGIPTIGLGSVSSTSFPARIIARGTGAFYSWNEVIPSSSGTWTDGHRSGTTTSHAALEQNTNTAVPVGTRVELFLVNGVYIFQLGPCTPISKAPVIPPEPPQSIMPTPPPPNAAIIGVAISTASGGSTGPVATHHTAGGP